ncbi:hypothetical protein [Actinoplanes aureus]|uniref:Uncharacterized protein n=1 Tax=Actinoplanes aureus TaxID=2792083 RepID=A0A931C505_9ACTN|nr:hypothetical protein [Actinoplanes aureus]MBG0560722.1 hypothetical protein [Actinoplanes aureus]
MVKIIAPNREYNGTVGDVQFKDGVADTDNPAVLAYCRSAGYEVGGETATTLEEPAPADPREVGNGLIGTPLRDAAVDPKPEDFLAPVNAGQANPHGAEVVSPEIHAALGPTPLVPGLVGDPAMQQDRESEAARLALVDQLPAAAVVDELADGNAQEQPAGNASQEAWADWVLATHPELDPESVRAMKRDDLRTEYGKTE